MLRTQKDHINEKPTIPAEIVDFKYDNDLPWLSAFRIRADLSMEEAAKALNLSVLDYAAHELSESPGEDILTHVSKMVGAQPAVLHGLYYG